MSSENEFLGTCKTMCPAEEKIMREKNNLLHYFEMMPGTERQKRPRANPDCMVKEYTRPAAGKEDARPSELRPPNALLRTVDYLIDKIVPRTDRPYNFVYDFVFDRLRAVRRDMVIQRIIGPTAVTILEKIIRFHIYSGYRLCSEPIAKFDPKINDTHIQECLKRLMALYNESCRRGGGNMGEFVSVYVLYNLGQTEAFLHAISLRHQLGSNPDFRIAVEMNFATLIGNYVRVLRLCHRLRPLCKCAVSSKLPHVQNEALQKMSAGFHSKALRYEALPLADLLLFDGAKDIQETCQTRGLNITEKGILFDKTAYKNIDKVPLRSFQFIDDSLRLFSVPALIHGLQEDTR